MLEAAAQFTVNEEGDQFGSTSLLGRDEFDRRLAVARAQVIWPLAVRRHLKGTIYGHAQVRADELGLAKREVLRWWDSYQYKGLMGVLPAGEMPPESRKRWECTLATLEDKLQAERTNWAKQGDRFFVEALRGVVGTGGLRAYPLLRDVIRTCERRIRSLTLCADNQAVMALERVEKAAGKLTALRAKKIAQDELEAAAEKLAIAKDQAIEAYSAFVLAIQNGQEWGDQIRYQSANTLRALHERLSELNSIGIFRAAPPVWSSRLRVHQIGALRDDERRLLVYTHCAAILRACMDAGQSTRLRRLIFLDEGHALLDDDGNSPLNRIVKEGRKFGLGLAIGSQSPTHFSADVLVNTATVIVTGLEAADREFAARKLNAPPELLKAVKPKAVVAVKLKRNGESEDGFRLVSVSAR